jgi:hypothetical protein
MTVLQATFETRLKAGIKHDPAANVYVTYCPFLQIYSQGRTKIVAKAALQDAVYCVLKNAYQKGVLEKVMGNAGLKPNAGDPRAVRVRGEEYIYVREEEILEQNHFEDVFEVPTSLEMASHLTAPASR